MKDHVPVLGVTPVTPHHWPLYEFVQEVKALYDLSEADELSLLNTVGNFVNIVAVNALALRPRSADPKEAGPQGVQDGPEFMRPDEVSHALGIPLSTLAHMRHRGDGPAHRKSGRAVLYRRDDVRGWIERGEGVPVLGTAAAPDDSKTDPSEVRDGA